MDFEGVDLYEILGVDRDATAEEIRAAYRQLAPNVHSDHGGTDALFRLIKQAHDVLTDPASRQRYDANRQVTTHHQPQVQHLFSVVGYQAIVAQSALLAAGHTARVEDMRPIEIPLGAAYAHLNGLVLEQSPAPGTPGPCQVVLTVGVQPTRLEFLRKELPGLAKFAAATAYVSTRETARSAGRAIDQAVTGHYTRKRDEELREQRARADHERQIWSAIDSSSPAVREFNDSDDARVAWTHTRNRVAGGVALVVVAASLALTFQPLTRVTVTNRDEAVPCSVDTNRETPCQGDFSAWRVAEMRPSYATYRVDALGVQMAGGLAPGHLLSIPLAGMGVAGALLLVGVARNRARIGLAVAGLALAGVALLIQHGSGFETHSGIEDRSTALWPSYALTAFGAFAFISSVYAVSHRRLPRSVLPAVPRERQPRRAFPVASRSAQVRSLLVGAFVLATIVGTNAYGATRPKADVDPLVIRVNRDRALIVNFWESASAAWGAGTADDIDRGYSFRAMHNHPQMTAPSGCPHESTPSSYRERYAVDEASIDKEFDSWAVRAIDGYTLQPDGYWRQPVENLDDARLYVMPLTVERWTNGRRSGSTIETHVEVVGDDEIRTFFSCF